MDPMGIGVNKNMFLTQNRQGKTHLGTKGNKKIWGVVDRNRCVTAGWWYLRDVPIYHLLVSHPCAYKITYTNIWYMVYRCIQYTIIQNTYTLHMSFLKSSRGVSQHCIQQDFGLWLKWLNQLSSYWKISHLLVCSGTHKPKLHRFIEIGQNILNVSPLKTSDENDETDHNF